jgi:hypothetical protein
MNTTINQKNSVLALYPNMRGYGYAYLENEQTPVDCGISPVYPISNDKCMESIKIMIEFHYPQTIILEKTDESSSHKSERVKTLLNQITHYATSRNIDVYYYSREYVAFVFNQFQAKTKQEMAERIGVYFPEYKKYVPEPRKPWLPEDYFMGLFDALGLAIAHYYKTT